MQEGWMCPVCRRINAPAREQCCTAPNDPAPAIPLVPPLTPIPGIVWPNTGTPLPPGWPTSTSHSGTVFTPHSPQVFA